MPGTSGIRYKNGDHKLMNFSNATLFSNIQSFFFLSNKILFNGPANTVATAADPFGGLDNLYKCQ